jgi:hypothetical protein
MINITDFVISEFHRIFPSFILILVKLEVEIHSLILHLLVTLYFNLEVIKFVRLALLTAQNSFFTKILVTF